MKTEYIEFFHDDDSVENLEQFIERNLLKSITPFQVLDYKDNSDNIVKAYIPSDGGVATVDILRSPCTIKIPVENVEREVILSQTNVAINKKDFYAFLSEEQDKIVSDDGYIENVHSNSDPLSGDTYRNAPRHTVWIYSRGLGAENTEGRLIDVTSFVEDMQTVVTKEGGSFSLILAPIIGIYDPYEGWIPDETSLTTYSYNGIIGYVGRSNYVYKKPEKESGRDIFKRKPFFFHYAIKSNDLVYIKFENLQMEKNDSVKIGDKAGKSIFIEGSNVESQIWDMIGLVDTNSLHADPSQGIAAISVVGRDLNKVLLEDGAFFFPLDFLQSSEEYFQGTYVRGDKPNTPLNRLMSGNLYFFNSFVDRTVEFSLKFIFNLLSNVPLNKGTNVFKYYDRSKITNRFEFFTSPSKSEIDPNYSYSVTKKLEENNRQSENNGESLRSVSAPGIWQIIKLAFDPEIKNRRLVDSSISMSQGNLMSFCKKVCQDPFVEFWGDTYGSYFYFTARKPPFTKSSYKKNKTIDILDSEVYSDNLMMDDGEVYSWYRLIPRGNYFGNDTVSLADFPAIFLDKYMEMWGNRPLEIVSNYIDYQGWISSSAGDRTDYLQSQALNDLEFIIESNAYKPFSRKGTIEIKEKRTVKVGMNIRYKTTGEIFHVVSVQNKLTFNSSGVERTTVLTVERGLVEKYYDKYFELVTLVASDQQQPLATSKKENKRFKVNEEVFNFFFKGEQFQQ